MSICMIIDILTFNERERLTALICLFCFVSTYLVFDFIAFDPNMRIDERFAAESIKANTSAEYYYISTSM